MIDIKKKKIKPRKKKIYFKLPKCKTKKCDIPDILKYQNTLLVAKLTSPFLSGISCLYIAQNNLSYNRNRGKCKI